MVHCAELTSDPPFIYPIHFQRAVQDPPISDLTCTPRRLGCGITFIGIPVGLGPGVEVLYIEAGDLDHGDGRVVRVL